MGMDGYVRVHELIHSDSREWNLVLIDEIFSNGEAEVIKRVLTVFAIAKINLFG